MSQSSHQTVIVENISMPWSSWLRDRATRSATKLQVRLELARARRLVRVLDDRQLADAGIDASTVLSPRPTFPVDSRLMTRLMSMR